MKPILFSPPLVRAILSGRKTVTRRLPRKGAKDPLAYFGKRGDLLWVREGHRLYLIHGQPIVVYLADNKGRTAKVEPGDIDRRKPKRIRGFGKSWPGRPAIFMEKALSRITLKITSIRLERLSEITGRDIKAEGFYRTPQGWTLDGEKFFASPMDGWITLWDSLAAPGMKFADDPEVIRVKFSVL